MDMNTNTNSNNYAQNGKVLLGSAILLFFMLIFLFFLHSYSCPCFHRRQRRRRRNQHLFPTSAAEPHTALDPSLFKLLPTFKYSSTTHLRLHECAVCLSEFKEHDDARLLPNCNHCFHTHCIDKWFRSHSTCPLCRALLQPSEISPAKTVAVVSDGEFAGCSYLPPPIPCPGKGLDLDLDLDMVRVIVEGMSENVRNSAGDVGLKSSGDGPGEWGPARPK